MHDMCDASLQVGFRTEAGLNHLFKGDLGHV